MRLLHVPSSMTDIATNDEDGFIRITEVLRIIGFRDFTNLQRTRQFQEALAAVAKRKGVDPSALVRTKRGRNGGSSVDPDVSEMIIDAFNARDGTHDAPSPVEPRGAAVAVVVPPAAPDGMDAQTATWCEAQSVLLSSLLRRKATLEAFGMCDDGTQQFFADGIANQKKRIIAGPPVTIYQGVADAPRVLAIMGINVDNGDMKAIEGGDPSSAAVDAAAPVVPSGQVAVYDQPIAMITYESLGVTDVLLRFAGVQLTSGQSGEMGRRAKLAYEAKYHKPPPQSQTRANGHLVDVNVYRRDDWPMILEEFAEYNKDLVRAHKPPIKAKHPFTPLV